MAVSHVIEALTLLGGHGTTNDIISTLGEFGIIVVDIHASLRRAKKNGYITAEIMRMKSKIGQPPYLWSLVK